jgi:hypothetical protein
MAPELHNFVQADESLESQGGISDIVLSLAIRNVTFATTYTFLQAFPWATPDQPA